MESRGKTKESWSTQAKNAPQFTIFERDQPEEKGEERSTAGEVDLAGTRWGSKGN